MNGKDIKKIRLSLKLSRDDFGKLIAVSKHTIQAWELGRRKPGKPTQKIIKQVEKGEK